MNEYKGLIGCFFVCCVVLCCGCVEKQHQSAGVVDVADDEVDTSMFIGTWAGSMEFSMFAWGNNTRPSTITSLEFTTDTLYMTITTANTSQVVKNSYNIEGDQLLVSPIFSGDMQFNRSQFNGSQRPPFDSTGSERPPFDFNGSERQPFDSERPFDGEYPSDSERPMGGERPSNISSYTYSFNEDNTIVYLNGTPFFKEM